MVLPKIWNTSSKIIYTGYEPICNRLSIFQIIIIFLKLIFQIISRCKWSIRAWYCIFSDVILVIYAVGFHYKVYMLSMLTKFYLFLQYIFERCKFYDSCFTLYEMFTEETINVHLQSYVTASTPVIAYLDKLFLSKNLGIDWWRLWKLKKTRMGLVILQVMYYHSLKYLFYQSMHVMTLRPPKAGSFHEPLWLCPRKTQINHLYIKGMFMRSRYFLNCFLKWIAICIFFFCLIIDFSSTKWRITWFLTTRNFNHITYKMIQYHQKITWLDHWLPNPILRCN